jgi:hypothetical protein
MAGNHVLLETIELTQSAASVTFDNIPQTGYTDLKIVASGRSGASANNNGYYDPLLYRFNGSTSSYSSREVYSYLNGAISDTNTTATSSGAGGTWGRLTGGGVQNSLSTANSFTSVEFYVPNYTTSNYKSISSEWAEELNQTNTTMGLVAALWSDTSAITSVSFALADGSFVAGSTFSLYGVADVNTTPVTAPLATGGNIVGNDGTYWYHAFLTSGTFTPQTALTCDYLVVAGGGGGGGDIGGGGGAGGLLSGTSLAVPAASYAVTVGAGGVNGVLAGGTSGANGNNSVFSSITSTGGGAGGGYTLNGGSGGSGGGGGTGNSAGGAAGSGGTASPSGQGNNGGAGVVHTGTNYGSGGGGGAGSAGGAGGQAVSGTRGAGIANSYSGSSVTYATGGLGGKYPGNYTLYAGTANTGDGGDGANGNSAGGNNDGRAGGSGIVIIRYAMV